MSVNVSKNYVPKTKRSEEIKKCPLSVVVITKNEEDSIVKCLRSVHGWADEIIMVDDQSTVCVT